MWTFRAALLLAVASAGAARAQEHVLAFGSPAAHFTESVPLGNGRLGAMVFGGVDEERLVLNESGMWSGSPQDADRPDAAAALPEIRRLLLEGRNAEAEQLVDRNFTCAGAGSGHGSGARVAYGAYQVLGNLRLAFTHAGDGPHEGYRRELDLQEAVGRVTYRKGGVAYVREVFVSAPDEVLVLRVSADRPRAVSFDLQLDRPERATAAARHPQGLALTGQLEDGRGGGGVRFASQVAVRNVGGSVSTDGTRVQVRGADEVVLLLAALTDIRSFAGRRADDPEKAALADLERAAARPFAELLRRHAAHHQALFGRVRLRLGPAAPGPPRPVPARLEALARGAPDPGLMQLYFDFGRYLLIASSRPGGLPANLQGIWAEEVQTPWNADWHLNVNVQMNYWPAEVANLSELHQPLFALISSLQEPGGRTARKYYGARGWVSHVITNPWGFTSPGESASWGATTTGSAWLVHHLWDHYLFTGDREFLAWAYPILKGSAEFYLDMLIEEPSHKWLVTAPSNSPENRFRLPDGGKAHICLGATMDMQLVRHLFGATAEAARLLDRDPQLRSELLAKRARLAPTRVGPDGRVMEWLEPYTEDDPHHRHVSHLWGLYPGWEIDPRATPELASAARRTLDARGDGGTGWSLAHKLSLWARLGDGDRAHALLRAQLKPARVVGSISTEGGGTYPNLFDAHPPFQIDGNFGAAAGIAEMLVQSQGEEIRLLPALPAAWAEGQVQGLRARGGFEVDVRWAQGRLLEVVLRSRSGTRARIRHGERVADLTLAAGERRRLGPDLR
jgi:alpha-L-fucosidase 2